MSIIQDYKTLNTLDKFLHSIDQKYEKSEYIYILISSAFISITQLLIKLQNDTSVFQILLFRGIFTFLVNYNAATHGHHNIYPKNFRTNKLLLTRAVLQSVTVVALFASCQYTDLGISTVLWLSNPIWTQIVSSLFFGQKYNKQITVYIILSFVGIITIFKPFKFMQTEYIESDGEDIYKRDYITNIIGQILALCASISFAFLSNISRQLKGRTSPSILIQYLYVGNTMFCGFMMIRNGNNDTKIYTQLDHFIPVLLVAITSLISQYLLQYALMKAKPQEIVPFIQIQVIFAIVFDCLIFGKSLEMLTILGSFIILYSCYKIATMKKNN